MRDRLRPVVETSKRRDEIIERITECRPRLSAKFDGVTAAFTEAMEVADEWNALVAELKEVEEEFGRAIEEAKG
jgi:uncharacterized coiled-coil DUF342 family protein